ncbi:uncharacterized protein LOC144325097 [Podarcis muralis]
MALSGVNQSHVQPVWAEIPSRSADIGARAVPSTGPSEEELKIILFQLGCHLVMDDGEGDPSNLSALPAQNLLADPVNSRLPSLDIQLEMGIFCSAAYFGDGGFSI